MTARREWRDQLDGIYQINDALIEQENVGIVKFFLVSHGFGGRQRFAAYYIPELSLAVAATYDGDHSRKAKSVIVTTTVDAMRFAIQQHDAWRREIEKNSVEVVLAR